MRGADVSNADVSQQIHGEIEVIGVLRLDDVENDGEFERQAKIGEGLRGVGDSVRIDFDRSDEKAIPTLCEVLQKGNAIDPTRHASFRSGTWPRSRPSRPFFSKRFRSSLCVTQTKQKKNLRRGTRSPHRTANPRSEDSADSVPAPHGQEESVRTIPCVLFALRSSQFTTHYDSLRVVASISCAPLYRGGKSLLVILWKKEERNCGSDSPRGTGKAAQRLQIQ